MKPVPQIAAVPEPVLRWLMRAGLDSATTEEVFTGVVERLREAGVPVARAAMGHTTLHPLYHSEAMEWHEETGLSRESYEFSHGMVAGGVAADAWRNSPLWEVIRTRRETFRRRLAGRQAVLDFPVLEEFRDAGYTDYFLTCMMFDSFFAPPAADEDEAIPDASGMIASYLTRREGGFWPAEIELFHALLRPLALVVKLATQQSIARNIAECYIGHEAGPLVLGGAIRLGDFASTEAVVWFSDMRSSTALAASLGRAGFTALINRFFACTIGAVVEAGGEPLSFMGDGAMAVFPIATLGAAGARRAAITAAARAGVNLTALNAERAAAGDAPIGWGIGLHAGEVDYGNIGVPSRHSWSVLGPVVNEAARLEGLTRTLGEPVLASAEFAGALDPPWRPLGGHALRGVEAKVEVFAPPLPAR
ncbi:MAG: adenylate/guanylate cyclase domain-containing protein [Alphaproteobacteria bacterium]